MLISPGAGFISLKGTSVWSSPPRVPQFNLTRNEYEMTIPIDSAAVFPSLPIVDDARLTSSSFKWPSRAIPENHSICTTELEIWHLKLTTTVFVGTCNGDQEEGFRETCAGCNWATFSCLQTCDVFAELSVDHRHLAMLHNKAFDALNSLARVVGHDDVGRDFFTVIVNFTIQRDFQVDFTLREGETLADKGWRQATTWGKD